MQGLTFLGFSHFVFPFPYFGFRFSVFHLPWPYAMREFKHNVNDIIKNIKHTCMHACILYFIVIWMNFYFYVLSLYIYIQQHCKKYLVKMNTSAWLLQFQGSLNSLVVWLRNSKTQLSSINSLTIPSSFKELAQTLVSKPTCNNVKTKLLF